jgi:hypothetical protein
VEEKIKRGGEAGAIGAGFAAGYSIESKSSRAQRIDAGRGTPRA